MKEILKDEDLREDEEKDSDSIDSISDKLKKRKKFNKKKNVIDRDKERAKIKILLRGERSKY